MVAAAHPVPAAGGSDASAHFCVTSGWRSRLHLAEALHHSSGASLEPVAERREEEVEAEVVHDAPRGQEQPPPGMRPGSLSDPGPPQHVAATVSCPCSARRLGGRVRIVWLGVGVLEKVWPPTLQIRPCGYRFPQLALILNSCAEFPSNKLCVSEGFRGCSGDQGVGLGHWALSNRLQDSGLF